MDSLDRINKALGTHLEQGKYDARVSGLWKIMFSLQGIGGLPQSRKRPRVSLEEGKSFGFISVARANLLGPDEEGEQPSPKTSSHQDALHLIPTGILGEVDSNMIHQFPELGEVEERRIQRGAQEGSLGPNSPSEASASYQSLSVGPVESQEHVLDGTNIQDLSQQSVLDDKSGYLSCDVIEMADQADGNLPSACVADLSMGNGETVGSIGLFGSYSN